MNMQYLEQPDTECRSSSQI